MYNLPLDSDNVSYISALNEFHCRFPFNTTGKGIKMEIAVGP